MLQLTAPQATLAVAIIAAIGGLLGWAGRGSTFLLHRWWTGAPQKERAAYLNSVADLAAKMKATGMTMAEVHQFEKIMRNPAIAGSDAVSEVVEALDGEGDTYGAFVSNVAMRARTGTAYDVADAQLEQALMDLRLLLREGEQDALEAAQEMWSDYRNALEVCAGLEFEGGTHAPLAGTLAGLSETERRTVEIRAQVDERVAR